MVYIFLNFFNLKLSGGFLQIFIFLFDIQFLNNSFHILWILKVINRLLSNKW
jgi:hypothetical protein